MHQAGGDRQVELFCFINGFHANSLMAKRERERTALPLFNISALLLKTCFTYLISEPNESGGELCFPALGVKSSESRCSPAPTVTTSFYFYLLGFAFILLKVFIHIYR